MVDEDRTVQVFYFPQRIMVNREKFLYPFITTMAEMGGYVGVLLGVSFLHGARAFAKHIRRQLQEKAWSASTTPVKPFHDEWNAY